MIFQRKTHTPGVARTLRRLGLVLASAAGLAACNHPTFYRDLSFGIEPIDAAWSAGFAGKTGLVEVYNLPQTATMDEFLADFSSPRTAAQAAGFTNNPAQAADPRYRIVVWFQAGGSASGTAACNLNSPEATQPSPATVQDVQAALCAGSQAVSEIRMRNDGPNRLADGDRNTDQEILSLLVAHLYRPPREASSNVGCSVLISC